jgi:succinyl-diaminopimelate desuccinylase
VQGGNGYSTIPDACVIRVDVRLTPSFGAADAEAVVRDACAAVDRRHPTREPTGLDVEGSWPAYRLPEDSRLVALLRESASHEFGWVLPLGVAGPSNAGNYLASCGIPATCGLGVTYRNLHGADERIEVSSILPVYRTYRRAVLELLGHG